MNGNFIRLWDVLELMDQVDTHGHPVKFQLKFVSADRKKNTGGEIIELIDCCICFHQHTKKESVFPAPSFATKAITKKPNHWVHSTRNLLMPNGQIRKVHIRLIIEFNHQTVCY